MPPLNRNTLCYCGSKRDFIHCCKPIISGQTLPETAEQLMRSRFSAFCCGNIDYLITSLHPHRQHSTDRLHLAQTMDQCEWQQLTILSTSQGLKQDHQGEVEFLASYRQKGQPHSQHLSQLHEKSRFIKEQGKWFYQDGDIYDATEPLPTTVKPGRNDCCWCGSGKKFKRCHG